jgi:alpha-ribazole phosphatase
MAAAAGGMKLHLLRHAPVLLPPGLCYGASDVAADEALTREAAQAAAASLPRRLPLRVSGLQRARQLAQQVQALRSDLGPAIVDTRLNEMNFGCWELQPWDAIPHAALQAWTADFDGHRFGGIESTGDVLRRVGQALAECCDGSEPSAEVGWITHAGVIRAVQYLLERAAVPVRDAAHWPRTAVPYGGLLTVEVDVPLLAVSGRPA